MQSDWRMQRNKPRGQLTIKQSLRPSDGNKSWNPKAVHNKPLRLGQRARFPPPHSKPKLTIRRYPQPAKRKETLNASMGPDADAIPPPHADDRPDKPMSRANNQPCSHVRL